MELRNYQEKIIDELMTPLKSAIIQARMGAGKTLTVLEWFQRYRDHCVSIGQKKPRMLIIGPIACVDDVWPNEVAKWGFDFTIELLHGKPKEIKPADIYTINFESQDFALSQNDKLGCTVLVVDESSKIKNPKSKRTKQLLQSATGFTRRIGLTGTPRPKSELDLFTQLTLIDLGKENGKSFYRWREKYFYCGYNKWDWKIRPDGEAAIDSWSRKNMIVLDKKDEVELPELLENIVELTMDASTEKQYKKMKRELLSTFGDMDVLASSAGVAYQKLKQMASGFIFENPNDELDCKPWRINYQKADAVVDKIEELQGKQVVIFYQHIPLVDAVCEKLKELKISFARCGGSKTVDAIKRFRSGEAQCLISHYDSIGYGVNLQDFGCNDVFIIQPPESASDYDQAICRVHRPGVLSTVFVTIFLTKNTVDCLAFDRCKNRIKSQAEFIRRLVIED